MPVITKITNQQRRSDRYSIYIDNAYRLSLPAEALQRAGIRVGDELTDAGLEELKQTAEVSSAVDRAYRYVAVRFRSRNEVQTYLRRKGFSEELITRALDILEQQGVIDDARFATAWVEDRLLLRSASRRVLQSELRQKGVVSEIIEQALASISEESEVDAVQELIEAKRLRTRYDDERKLIQYLSSKGFSYNTIKTALSRLDDPSNQTSL